MIKLERDDPVCKVLKYHKRDFDQLMAMFLNNIWFTTPIEDKCFIDY